MRLLTYGQLRELIGYSRTHLRRLMADTMPEDRRFPRPLDFGGRIRWVEQEVLDWLNRRPRRVPSALPDEELEATSSGQFPEEKKTKALSKEARRVLNTLGTVAGNWDDDDTVTDEWTVH